MKLKVTEEEKMLIREFMEMVDQLRKAKGMRVVDLCKKAHHSTGLFYK